MPSVGSSQSLLDGFRRDRLRALAQRIEVADREVRIISSPNEPLRPLATSNGVETVANGIRLCVPEWRTGRDSNPRYPFEEYDGLAIRWFKPLTHLSEQPGRPALGRSASLLSCSTGRANTAADRLPFQP